MKPRTNPKWPVLKTYDQDHLARIALPIGGIGTGTVSLGGRGDLRDWEIMNRPGKGVIPAGAGRGEPSFVIYARPAGRERRRTAGRQAITRMLEGPLDFALYEGASGARAPSHGMPRFADCSFAAAYPLGQVMLSDADVPVAVRIEAFNPLIPADADASGIPVAVLRYVVTNTTSRPLSAAICASLPNFIGSDGSPQQPGPKKNRNRFRRRDGLAGIFMDSTGVAKRDATWGTIALATTAAAGITYRTSWMQGRWGEIAKDFWEDFASDGRLDRRPPDGSDSPTASLAVSFRLAPRASREITFLLTWHFPNRLSWSPGPRPAVVGNYYTTKYRDAWDVARKVAPRLRELERRTVEFVRAFCAADLPEVVKEAALFNVANLRTQTCFRTADGRFFGFEGYQDHAGCCLGSCTHVWNYEQAVAFLFGDLAKMMREVEFAHATEPNGRMSFRVHLPLSRAKEMGKAAADGQMGCIMKIYRDWQLSGDDAMLRRLWPKVKKALGFCWVAGGWDGDRDGVMEGAQHNTMDVEYYGPNPQMQGWYLGALRAGEEMARYLGDKKFAATCRDIFERGRAWTDKHLFNGEYYEHEIRPPKRGQQYAAGTSLGAPPRPGRIPRFQLGPGCLVDQLVGQFVAHVCGLGYIVRPANVRKTYRGILKYNLRSPMRAHFNCMRTFALGEESALLMSSYPKGRLESPFPYFTEVMTGFEYAAAVGMLQEGMTTDGLKCIKNIRDRYDGRKRSPFNEAECGNHYSRAMASWAAVVALTGFSYSGVEKSMAFAAKPGTFFWSNGHAWGTCALKKAGKAMQVALSVTYGRLALKRFELRRFGAHKWARPLHLAAGKKARFTVKRS
ncbi:MAG: GH116 family glycosyl-hydrolase [Planctomycetota bacterium]|jgi:uncharacterized protein (DUF608 family)